MQAGYTSRIHPAAPVLEGLSVPSCVAELLLKPCLNAENIGVSCKQKDKQEECLKKLRTSQSLALPGASG